VVRSTAPQHLCALRYARWMRGGVYPVNQALRIVRDVVADTSESLRRPDDPVMKAALPHGRRHCSAETIDSRGRVCLGGANETAKRWLRR
jgi:hypothetical protein